MAGGHPRTMKIPPHLNPLPTGEREGVRGKKLFSK